ncbi:MAG TPA: hypothetical protein VMC07_02440 [Candidatus Omnitrophota bacterium]|nr:hypothetical protein [Candidatus Omnitrophota bacterium]
MADEQQQTETEIAKVRKVGVLSLAGTFALITFFFNIILGGIIYLVFPVVTGLLPFSIPFVLSFNYIILFVIGTSVLTFFYFLIFGMFYNLSSLITKGVKLYSD